jgi:uncharacterized protein (DUF1501 family)
MQRKQFIQTGALVTASMWVPRFLKAIDAPSPFAPVPVGNKVVVVLQLNGGNDGLNTIIPITNDVYYKLRPKLGISKQKSLQLNSEAGVNPALRIVKEEFDKGNVAILNNVGYPNPDRSHFRSMDIWQSASNSNEYIHTGWIGRYLDAQCKGCDKPTQALEMDDMLSLALKGENVNGLAMRDPKKLFKTSNENLFNDIKNNNVDAAGEQPVDYLYKTLANTLQSADYVYKQSQQKPSSATYPATELGQSLKNIASLILSDINTKIYYVSLGSFDTHVNQDGAQTRLFTQLNDAVTAFINDLKQNGRYDDTLLFTFSEFGRRVAQNFSGGTDHGTANNMLFFSGGLKQKGLLNELPNLTDLQDGDLKYKVDFKQVYATVLQKWLGAKPETILRKSYELMDFI